jgi:hypothetical protein
MRFYRILDEGQDGLTNDEPTISITTPSSGITATGELEVSVSAYSDQPVVTTKLYVDGQEMNPSYDGTNYFINTCEWYNGQHTLFATATAYSSSGSQFGGTGALVGHTVSSFVPVYFSNLVTEISFSQPFFQPSLGQTQEVTAYIVENSDWTLTVRDVNSNAVKTVTGVGNYLDYLWNGVSDGGTNVPNGIYYYFITAATNGLANEVLTNNGGSVVGSPPSPDDESRLYATSGGTSEDVVPLEIYPPGFDTNGLTIFSATPSEVKSLTASDETASTASVSRIGGITPDVSGGSGVPSGQNTPPAPDRPGSQPIVNASGSYGIGCDTYVGNGINGYYQPQVPYSYNYGGGLEGFVSIQGQGTANPPKWYAVPFTTVVCGNFSAGMSKGGWAFNIYEKDDNLSISQLKASGNSNPFNTNDFAIWALHCGYGTTTDMSTGKSFKQVYFPITSGTGASYLRMSDLNLGGSSSGVGLKWLCLLACNSLYPTDWNSMSGQSVFPYNSNMHMIMGGATDLAAAPDTGTFLAQDMIGNAKAVPPVAPMTIRAAWYDANTRGMALDSKFSNDYANPTQCNVAADANCLNDYLQTATNTVLNGGTWTLDSAHTVYSY